MTANFDFVIVGSGIVGLTVTRELKRRFPTARIAVLEKENTLGVHASGRNSGVLHCGIYYGSDTLKAKVCSTGAARLIQFAKEHHLPCIQSGKVILATSDHQMPAVERLMKNARDNGIKAERINEQQLRELEPAAAAGPAAIYCPDTAVIDSVAVLKKLHAMLEQDGVTFFFGCKVKKSMKPNQLMTPKGEISYGFLFNCAGAYADTIAHQFGLANDYTMLPFKGIYWKLSSKANSMIRSNIYPVPDLSLPFLGVHLTRVISDDVYVGPTSIPVLGRENYSRLKGIKLKEIPSMGYHMAYMYITNQNNFRILAHREMAKYSKKNFVIEAKKLVPQLQDEDLVPTPKAGIRPQLINVKTKKLEMDYIFERSEHSLHVLNAISPAFTSSFAFAEVIVDRARIS